MRKMLDGVKKYQNVTLSLPKAMLRRFRVYAAARNRPMTSVMTEAIQTLLDNEERTEKAKRRFLERIRNAPDLGTRGVITWTGDEIHER